MDALQDWSTWIKPGYFISYYDETVQFFEYVRQRDLAHWEYDWPETIDAGSESGPNIPSNLEITQGYQKHTNTNRLWQLIFGIKGQPFIYIELPTDLHRHGIPKEPKPTSNNRRVSHYTEWMSPFNEPSFVTEHFMMKPALEFIGIDAYNPTDISITDLTLNFFINKMVTERVGTATPTEEGMVIAPTSKRWSEALDKLWRRVIPCRPITLMPVRAPAVGR